MKNQQPINKLPKNQLYQINQLIPNIEFGELDNMVTQRLADLGFGAGQTVEVISKGMFGRGPFAVRLGNQSQFILRVAEARKIICVAFQAT